MYRCSTYQPLALAQLRVLADARGVGGLCHVHALRQHELENARRHLGLGLGFRVGVGDGLGLGLGLMVRVEDARRHLEGARQPQVVAHAVVGGDEAAVVVTATHLPSSLGLASAGLGLSKGPS